MTGRLDKKVAIVTGAADGMGNAIARLFLKEGASVVATDINGEKLNAAMGSDPKVRSVAIDITAADAPTKIVETAIEAFGGIDIVVNAAGIFQMVDVTDIELDIWDRTMAVNVTAPMRLTLAAIPALKRSGQGRIINIASINSKLARRGASIYTTSKHAIAGFTISLAVELGEFGITANWINPGTILTGITRPYMEDPVWAHYMENQNVLGRIGQPEEIAHAALYLADPMAGFTTGHGLTVDGGYTARFDDAGLVGNAGATAEG
jgi:NAD(P)-dependent dehydrogenase (short-subunit alcohol dehydrogenase family)